MRIEFYLSGSSRLRYTSSAMLYFAQGLPYGLLSIAIPAWLASRGLEAGAIASYLAVIILPWAFKLATGPLMDRFKFPSMGQRRPWVLGAQLGLTISLLSLGFVDDPMSQLPLLTVLGLITNCFAATQDVAVDGMAIDLVPEAEHGRINAFMACGKAIGWASTAAGSGWLLVNYGLAMAGLVASVIAGIVFVAFLFVREREGESLLPWTPGEPSQSHAHIPDLRSVFTSLKGVLWSRPSQVILAVMLVDGLVSGYGHALMPIAAVKLFGFTTGEWSNLVAVMGLTGAFAALALGPVIDRVGAKRMFMLTILLVAVHAFLLAGTQHLWNNSFYVRGMLSAWVLMGPVTMVCAIAIAMSICTKGVSATQFAIYMSTANLGASIGSKLFGMASEHASYSQSYLLMGVLFISLFLIVTIFRKQQPEELVSSEEGAGG